VTDNELTPTPAAEWPKNVAQTVTLPSGGVAKVKRPDAFALIRSGKVPKKVAALMMSQGEKTFTEAEAVTLIEFLIAASFVDPVVTLARTAGAVCIRDVGDDDKGFVMNLLGLV
jgi:hypothetical protein